MKWNLKCVQQLNVAIGKREAGCECWRGSVCKGGGRSHDHRSLTPHSACERQNSPGPSLTALLNCAFSTHTKLR